MIYDRHGEVNQWKIAKMRVLLLNQILGNQEISSSMEQGD